MFPKKGNEMVHEKHTPESTSFSLIKSIVRHNAAAVSQSDTNDDH